jgi:uncharacterized protein (DUF924 family)
MSGAAAAPDPAVVLDFWFSELQPGDWYRRDPVLDQRISARFSALHGAAIRCELHAWRASPGGRLAEILVLDQFSRNIFRDLADAFASDGMALCLSQEAIAAGAPAALSPVERAFLYMPFMHSESPLVHEQAVTLYSEAGLEYNLQFELRHKAIIDRFGRYPHRNAILGRQSTAGELEFLQQPGSSF